MRSRSHFPEPELVYDVGTNYERSLSEFTARKYLPEDFMISFFMNVFGNLKKSVVLVAFLAVLGTVILFIRQQFLTGDELRYLLYATSFIRHLTLVMPVEEWSAVTLQAARFPSTTLPSGGNSAVVMNGVYLPVFLSPVAGLFSLAGLRFVTLLTGFFGLFRLFRMASGITGQNAALAATMIAALSLPLIAYLHVFYMEAFLFTFTVVSWERICYRDRNAGWKQDSLTAAILVAIPFIHMRGCVVAVFLSFLLLQKIWASNQKKRAVLISACAAAVGVVFILANLAVYGAITGPVNSARPPLPGEWFSVISMQLFNVRHGFFAYAPIWIIGYAGLLYGSLGKPVPLARQALILAVIAAFTGVGVNPGECWPARFWCLSLPMLTVGLAIWMRHARGLATWLAFLLLLLPTLLNTGLYFYDPNVFVENRQFSATWEILFRHLTSAFRPGYLLPVEDDDPADMLAAAYFTFASMAVILLCVGALRWRLMSLPVIGIFLAIADLSHVKLVPCSGEAGINEPHRLVVSPSPPIRAFSIMSGRPYESWFTPGQLHRFHVSVFSEAGKSMSWSIPANQVVTVSCNVPVRQMELRTDDFDLTDEVNYHIDFAISRSVLRRWFAARSCREL